MRNRKGLLTLAILVSLALLSLTPGPAAAQGPSSVPQASLERVEPRAGTRKTHVLTSGSEVRLPAPPDAAATQAELVELRALAARRDGAALDQISYWDAGWPGYR